MGRMATNRPANRLTSVTDWNSNSTAYSYDDAGRMTTATLPSGTGIVSTYSYDNADRLTGISHVKNGSTTIASVTYTLDDVGNRTQRVDQQGTHTYAYDDLYRLTSVTYPGPSTTSYTFDAFGNRTSMTDGSGTTDYTYDDADRLTEVDPPSASAVAYTWDDNGNLTDRGSDEFEWDEADRMVSATVDSTTTTFAYRGDGLRESRTLGMSTTTFTWDVNAGLPVVLYDGSYYLYGFGLEAMEQSGDWYYFLADGLGSTMAIVDDAGAVQNSYTYDVYGEAEMGSRGGRSHLPSRGCAPYFPFQFGVRFSANARGPSTASSLVRRFSSHSYFPCPASGSDWCSPWSAASFVARTESGAHWRISPMYVSTIPSRSASGATSFTSPNSSAFAAGMCRPVSM